MRKMHYQDSPTEKERKDYAPFLAEDEELVLAVSFGSTYLKSQVAYKLIWPGGLVMAFTTGYAYWNGFNLGYGLLAGLVLASFLAVLLVIRMKHANRYILTTRRVMIKKGILAVRLSSALYDKITHLEVDQNFMDKVFMHHGTIIVHTAGSSSDEMVLRYVDWPIEFKNLLERLINRQRQDYGRSATPLVAFEGEIIK